MLSVDGQAAADPTLGQQRAVGGLGRIFSAVSGTQIDTYNFETLVLAEERVRTLAERVRALRCAMGPVIDGPPAATSRATSCTSPSPGSTTPPRGRVAAR